MELFNALKSIDPMLAVAFMLTFTVTFMLGQHITEKDASEVEVASHDPYKAPTLDECATDDPIYLPDSVPIIEPIDCESGDKECLKQNENAGKPAQTVNLKH